MSSSEGPEIECPLEAGAYRTAGFHPELTYTVPSAGWSSLNRLAAPGNFHLFPPGGGMAGFNEGTTDDITVLSAVVPPGQCTGTPSSELAQTYDGLIEFLSTDDHIAVSDMKDVSVAGWAGKVMDIRFVQGDGCPDGSYADLMVGVAPSHGAFGITPGMAGVRLYLLRDPEKSTALAILVDDAANGGSDYGDADDWYNVADSVVDTFVFKP